MTKSVNTSWAKKVEFKVITCKKENSLLKYYNNEILRQLSIQIYKWKLIFVDFFHLILYIMLFLWVQIIFSGNVDFLT